jgi:hypothetical protein
MINNCKFELDLTILISFHVFSDYMEMKVRRVAPLKGNRPDLKFDKTTMAFVLKILNKIEIIY